jgi:hypothetical protein
MRFRNLALLAIIGALPGLTGCENADDKSIAQAQQCLNNANPSTATACSQLIANLATPEAYMVRCSVDFLSQGFTSNRYISAFQNINNNSGSSVQRPALEAIGYLNFPDSTSVAQALSDCSAAGSSSLRRIAELAQISTTLAAASYSSASPSTSVTTAQSDITTEYGSALTCVSNNSATAISTGTEAVVLYNDFCASSTPFQNSDICAVFSTLFSGGLLSTSSPPVDIGCAFMGALLE